MSLIATESLFGILPLLSVVLHRYGILADIPIIDICDWFDTDNTSRSNIYV